MAFPDRTPTEKELGEHALDIDDFNPTFDGSVRTAKGTLSEKLIIYDDKLGYNDPVVFRIPEGYRLTVTFRDAVAAPPPAAVVDPIPPPPPAPPDAPRGLSNRANEQVPAPPQKSDEGGTGSKVENRTEPTRTPSGATGAGGLASIEPFLKKLWPWILAVAVGAGVLAWVLTPSQQAGSATPASRAGSRTFVPAWPLPRLSM